MKKKYKYESIIMKDIVYNYTQLIKLIKNNNKSCLVQNQMLLRISHDPICLVLSGH